MIDKNYFKTMKPTFPRQHMVNDTNDDGDDDDNEAYPRSPT